MPTPGGLLARRSKSGVRGRIFSGNADTKGCVGKLPQRPLKGRWGYVSKFEEFFLNFTKSAGDGYTKLQAVFAIVWASGNPAAEAPLDGRAKRKKTVPAIKKNKP